MKAADRLAAVCCALAILAAVPAAQAQPSNIDLYVTPSGTLDGDGSLANPVRRITDAVERARTDREGGASEAIQIHVAPGTYVGSYDAAALALHPEYEVLPIILNVSGLAVLGSTTLVRDVGGLPTGSEPLSDTILEPDAPMGPDQSLFLIANTSDGSMGNGVTVDGFVLDEIAGAFPHIPVIVDRVSEFRISNNVIQHGDYGIYTRLASGTIEGNLLWDNDETGGGVQGGSLARPSTVLVHANRITANGLHGLMAMPIANNALVDPGANTIALEPPLQRTFDRNNPTDLQNIPDTLTITLSDNEFSASGFLGIRFIYVVPYDNGHDNCPTDIGYATLDATQPLTGVVTAYVTGNTFTGDGDYGVGVEAGFPCRSDPRSLISTFAGTFEGNTFAESTHAGTFSSLLHGVALFSFDEWDISLRLSSGYQFLKESTYQVTDLDGELADLDYMNPLTDPFSGATLDNRLVVNGVEVPHGARGGFPACFNSIDDDGDGLIDSADPGCPRQLPLATTESPQCDDGLDNNGNGLVDFSDPNCSPSWPYWETTPSLSCGLGGEIALLLAPMSWVRRRLRGR